MLLVNLSGRGDKDIFNVSDIFQKSGVIREDGTIDVAAINR